MLDTAALPSADALTRDVRFLYCRLSENELDELLAWGYGIYGQAPKLSRWVVSTATDECDRRREWQQGILREPGCYQVVEYDWSRRDLCDALSVLGVWVTTPAWAGQEPNIYELMVALWDGLTTLVQLELYKGQPR